MTTPTGGRRGRRRERDGTVTEEGGVKLLHGPSTDDIMPVQRKTGRCSPPFWTTLRGRRRRADLEYPRVGDHRATGALGFGAITASR